MKDRGGYDSFYCGDARIAWKRRFSNGVYATADYPFSNSTKFATGSVYQAALGYNGPSFSVGACFLRMTIVGSCNPICIERRSMSAQAHKRSSLLIKGITQEGRAFRPSDWAERLAEVIALFIRERGGTQPSASYAVPCVEERVKSLRLDAALHEACPAAFEFVMRFAEDNGLPVRHIASERDAA